VRKHMLSKQRGDLYLRRPGLSQQIEQRAVRRWP
jgi:hypothetical protein